MLLGRPACAKKSIMPRLWSRSVSLREASFTDGQNTMTGLRFTLSVSELVGCFWTVGQFPSPTAPRLVNIGRIVEQKGQAILDPSGSPPA